MWVRDIFGRHLQFGEYHCLVQEMRIGDSSSYFMYFRYGIVYLDIQI